MRRTALTIPVVLATTLALAACQSPTAPAPAASVAASSASSAGASPSAASSSPPAASPSAPSSSAAPAVSARVLGFGRIGDLTADLTAQQIGDRIDATTKLERFGGCGAATYASTAGDQLAPALSVLAESRGPDGRVDTMRLGAYGEPPAGASTLPRTAEGLGIGSTLTQLRAAYPALKEAPNAYESSWVEATLPGPDGLAMVFHVIGDGTVTGVSTGRVQQLRYIEGCL